MNNPRIEVDLGRLGHNVRTIVGLCHDQGISVAGVTKAFLGDPAIARSYVDGGCSYLADARVENLKKLEGLGLPRMMLRQPMLSEVEEVVRHAEISLNSELVTLARMDQAAAELGVVHEVILMMDLGDLREGYYDEYELFHAIEIIRRNLPNIRIIGVGVNLTCFGGVIPDEDNLLRLVIIGRYIQSKYDLKLQLISGGNSSSLPMVMAGEMVEGINNLRIGEAFLTGKETAYGERIPGTKDRVFTLVAEVIELKTKASQPTGIIGRNAFGEVPEFEDVGMRRVAICAIGRQDVSVAKLKPRDPRITIIGSSSDHVLLDFALTGEDYEVGSEIRFDMSYGAILSAMTSPYVYKDIKQGAEGRLEGEEELVREPEAALDRLSPGREGPLELKRGRGA